MLEQLPLAPEGEFARCIPFPSLTVELAVYWLALVEFIQKMDTSIEDADVEGQLQYAICELSSFCEYLSKYINYIKEVETGDPESWEAQENQFKLHILIEILLTFDLGDEVGRQNLNSFVSKALSTQILGENVVQKLVQCVENLLTDSDARLQYFIDIIRGIIDPNSLIDVADPTITKILDNVKDAETKIKISQLKFRILELREMESDLSEQKDYARLEKVTEELAEKSEEFVNTINNCAMIDASSTLGIINDLNSTVQSNLNSKKLTKEWILHSLEICFFAVCSTATRTLTPNMFKLYEEFVQRHMKSPQMDIRDRALKCGISFSMLYEQLAKEVHQELYLQFVKHHQPRIWTTAVNGICELFDRYTIDFFESDGDKANSLKAKKTRQLYRASEPDDEVENAETRESDTNVIYLFTHLFDTCQETTINMALATGFCRLILGGHYETQEIMSKIILKFFDPTTSTEINQILSVFFETLIQRGKFESLEKALMPTICTILDAPNDSPLREIKADTVVKFIVNSTLPPTNRNAHQTNIHNSMATTFLKTMQENSENKELIKILSKELPTLDVDNNQELRNELKELTENLLVRSLNDAKIERYLKSFKEMLSGSQANRSRLDKIDSEDEEQGDEEQDQNDAPAQPVNQTMDVQTSIADSSGIIDENTENNSNQLNISTGNQTSGTNAAQLSPASINEDIEMVDDNANTSVPNQSRNISSDEESQVTSASAKKVTKSSAAANRSKAKENSIVNKSKTDETENSLVSLLFLFSFWYIS